MVLRNLSKSTQLIIFYAVLGVLSSAALTNALNCYACSYLEEYSDTSCLTNASSLPPINCTKRYCLTVRQEALHNASKVISFLRDCQDKPLILNGVRTDASSRFYYRSCQQDLCNDHDGRGNSSGGDGSGTGGNHNGIVPGKNGGVSHNQTRMTLLQAAGIMLLLLGTCNYNFN